MKKLRHYLNAAGLWLTTGNTIRMVNDGEPVEPVVIRYKEFYIELLVDTQTGEPRSFGWSTDATMSPVPIREHYIAERKAIND